MFSKADFNDISWWICHVNEDLSPFTCIVSTCFESPTYARRSEWASHTDRDHGIFWSRNPSTPDRGICPLCCVHLEDPGDAQTSIDQSTAVGAPQNSSKLLRKFHTNLENTESKITSMSSRGKGKAVQFAIAQEDSQPTIGAIDRATETAQAGDYATQKLYSAMMLNHVADHLQFLALLTLRLSMEKLAVGNVQVSSSSQAISSDGTPEKRSSLNSEFDPLKEKFLEGLDKNRSLEESLDLEVGSTMDWASHGTANETQKDEIGKEAPIDWNLYSGLKPATAGEKDDVIEHMQELRVKEYNSLMERVLNSFSSGIYFGLPVMARDALARIESTIRGGAGRFAALTPVSYQETAFRREDIHEIFDGLFSSINCERDGVVDYCTEQVWATHPYWDLQHPMKKRVASRRRLFAMLVICKSPLDVLRFIKEGISDLDIPLSMDALRKCFPTWSKNGVASFIRVQSQILPRHLEVAESSLAQLRLSTLDPSNYKVGWICTLPIEVVAAKALLDEENEIPEFISPYDNNEYTLGRVGRHNVIIAALPSGEHGQTPAVSVARNMLRSFPNVRICLMVGIGGGAPSKKHDIRLGDVVVGYDLYGESVAFRYDFGTTMQNREFQITGLQSQLPTLLRSAVSNLEAHYEIEAHKFQHTINSILEAKPRLQKKCQRPHPETDRLYHSDVVHPPASDEHCAGTCCDDGLSMILRKQRTGCEDDIMIHYGLIASSNIPMRDALIRDYLADEKDILCFGTESMGQMNHFPCLVIRGICDYSDSHKNELWQGYASMTAAAYAKDILKLITPDWVETEKYIIDIPFEVPEIRIDERVHLQYDQPNTNILNWLTPLDYGLLQHNYFRRRYEGTGKWFLNSDQFQNWLMNENQMLFCPGVPGAGKTILTSTVIDEVYSMFQGNTEIGIAYVYGSYRPQAGKTIVHLLESLLKQLVAPMPSPPSAVQDLYDKYKFKQTRPSGYELARALRSVTAIYSRVFILIDALDSWQPSIARTLLNILEIQSKTRANLFITSRFIPEIAQLSQQVPTLEIRASEEDIRRYLYGNMHQLQGFVRNYPGLQKDIITGIPRAVQGIFSLAQIYLDFLRKKNNQKQITTALQELATGSSAYGLLYDETMERIVSQSKERTQLAKSVLSWIANAQRPLTVTEVQYALGMEPGKWIFDKQNLAGVELIVSACAGLVTIDKYNNTAQAVHYTAKEYLKQTHEKWFQNLSPKMKPSA